MLWSDFEEFGKFFGPWQELERISRALSRFTPPAAGEFPPVNVRTSGDSALLTTEVPGMDPKDLEISVTGKTLTLKGSRRSEELGEDASYHRRERWYGQFTRSLELPFTVEADKVQARFAKGVLSIALPRAEAEKPRTIAIRAE